MISFIVFLPLIASIIVGLNSARVSSNFAKTLTSSGLVIAAILSYITFYDVAILGNSYEKQLISWISSGDFVANWVLKVDSLTAVMLVLVTTVSAVVHIYSIGYMSHDEHLPRFMAYLSLFTFFMLMLVTSNNFLQMFLGWEGVGLCSYLLIGFWYKKDSARKAAIKAFVVNRVGDFGFILGIFAIYQMFGTLSFVEIFENPAQFASQTYSFLGTEYNSVTVICVLLFIGAMGKSAQLGLHVWLPDAMEGPTPVSALIHAATMVTAGVFMVSRCSALFELSDFARNLVTYVGAFTALFAASVAITQNDIKKVIAYSTCSQLGYMFFACGVSAYSAGVFHLFTHGFFKALLFLGAGSVIHALSDEQDLRKMGGIWKKIPFTYTVMFIGSLALAGIPPFAGYFSKDIVLESAYVGGDVGRQAYWIGIVVAFLTAFYSWRLLILAFHGKNRSSKQVYDHVHESPLVMKIPLIILSVGAVISGFVGYKLGMVDYKLEFWNGSIFALDENNPLKKAKEVELWVKKLPLLAGILGIALAYLFYMYRPSLPGKIKRNFKPLYNISFNKWYFDELYNLIFIKSFKALGSVLWKILDVIIIDGGGPKLLSKIVAKLSGRISIIQSGLVYHYAFIMLLAMFALMSWFIFNFYIEVK